MANTAVYGIYGSRQDAEPGRSHGVDRHLRVLAAAIDSIYGRVRHVITLRFVGRSKKIAVT